jgi:hypothetical protein
MCEGKRRRKDAGSGEGGGSGFAGDVLPLLQQLRMVCSSGSCSQALCMHIYHRISSLFTNAATVCDCGAGGGDEGAEELEELSRKGTAYFDAKSTKYQVRMSGMYSSHMLVSFDHIAMSDSATTA